MFILALFILTQSQNQHDVHGGVATFWNSIQQWKQTGYTYADEMCGAIQVQKLKMNLVAVQVMLRDVKFINIISKFPGRYFIKELFPFSL